MRIFGKTFIPGVRVEVEQNDEENVETSSNDNSVKIPEDQGIGRDFSDENLAKSSSNNKIELDSEEVRKTSTTSTASTDQGFEQTPTNHEISNNEPDEEEVQNEFEEYESAQESFETFTRKGSFIRKYNNNFSINFFYKRFIWKTKKARGRGAQRNRLGVCQLFS